MHHAEREPSLVLRVEAGPDARRTISCRGGPVVLGRAPGPGRIVDPSLEAHHLLVEPRSRTLVQLAGRLSVRMDGVAIDGEARIVRGAVIEVGATRLVASGSGPAHALPSGTIVLGVGAGRHRDIPWPVAHAFADLVTSEPAPRPVALDLGVVRRILVTGPSADGLVRSIVAQAGRIVVSDRATALRSPPPDTRVVIVADQDPEAGWPGGDLPCDGVVIGVGASWAATLTARTRGGCWSVRRFHAAGLPDLPSQDGPRRTRQGRTGRSSLRR